MTRMLKLVSRHACVPSLDQRYGEAARRDPRRFPVGYLAADGATGAVGPFLWFRDLGDLMRFVATIELGLLRLSPVPHARVTDALAAMVRRERDVTGLPLALSTAFRGWTEFLWVGRFIDLCHADGTIPTALRAELRSTPAGAGPDVPLDDGEVPDLLELLRVQAETCCGAPVETAEPAAGRARPTA